MTSLPPLVTRTECGGDPSADRPACAESAAVPAPRMPVLRGEIERLRLLLLRYALEAVASLVMFGGMFLVFAYLGSVMQGRLSPFDGDPRVLAVLYGVWMIVSTAAGGCTSQLGADAATGVLEGLFLTATPVVRILEMRALAHALHGIAMAAILLAAFCLGTGWLPSPAVVATLLACVAACTLTGLGLALALSGAALLSKRVGAMLIPINFLCMLAVMGGPARTLADPFDAAAALPFVAAAAALRQVLRDDTFAPGMLATAVLGALPCYLIGRGVLVRCIRACRRRGGTHTY
jgi:hypothetical protein